MWKPCALFEFRNVSIDTIRGRVLTKQTVIPTRRFPQDMHVDLPHIIKHVANLDCIRLVLNLEFVGFSHG